MGVQWMNYCNFSHVTVFITNIEHILFLTLAMVIIGVFLTRFCVYGFVQNIVSIEEIFSHNMLYLFYVVVVFYYFEHLMDVWSTTSFMQWLFVRKLEHTSTKSFPHNITIENHENMEFFKSFYCFPMNINIRRMCLRPFMNLTSFHRMFNASFYFARYCLSILYNICYIILCIIFKWLFKAWR